MVLVCICFHRNQFESSQIRAARHQHQADAALQPCTMINTGDLQDYNEVTTKQGRKKKKDSVTFSDIDCTSLSTALSTSCSKQQMLQCPSVL